MSEFLFNNLQICPMASKAIKGNGSRDTATTCATARCARPLGRVCLELRRRRPTTIIHSFQRVQHAVSELFLLGLNKIDLIMAENGQDWKKEDEDDGDQEIDETVICANT